VGGRMAMPVDFLDFPEADPALSYWRISFRDNGIGFDPAYRDKIFQLFQRLHSKSEYSGTGIGLSIVNKVCENHHGYVRAFSRENEGAEFVLLLPAI
jgi:signal transduction histidine kinase